MTPRVAGARRARVPLLALVLLAPVALAAGTEVWFVVYEGQQWDEGCRADAVHASPVDALPPFDALTCVRVVVPEDYTGTLVRIRLYENGAPVGASGSLGRVAGLGALACWSPPWYDRSACNTAHWFCESTVMGGPSRGDAFHVYLGGAELQKACGTHNLAFQPRGGTLGFLDPDLHG